MKKYAYTITVFDEFNKAVKETLTVTVTKNGSPVTLYKFKSPTNTETTSLASVTNGVLKFFSIYDSVDINITNGTNSLDYSDVDNKRHRLRYYTEASFVTPADVTAAISAAPVNAATTSAITTKEAEIYDALDNTGNAFDPTAAPANIYIEEAFDDITVSAANRYSFCRIAGKPTLGYRWKWVKTGNVWVTSGVHQGRLVPAYYYTHAPDDSAGLTPATSGGYRYHTIGTGDHASWDVPAVAAGHDKLVLVYYQTNTNPVLKVEIVRGEDTTVVDAAVALSGTGYLTNVTKTLTLPIVLAEGDVIKLSYAVTSQNSCLVHAIWTYDSDGVVSDPDQHMALTGDLAEVVEDASAIEYAYNMAPTGEAGKWIGGLHNGGTNMSQVSVTETFTVDGVSYTLAQGWKAGARVEWARTSTVQYDADPTNIGSLTETYTLNGISVSHRHKIVASAALDGNQLYGAMFPIPSTDCEKLYLDGLALDVSTLTGGDSLYGLAAGTRTVKMSGPVAGCLVCMQAAPTARPVQDVFLNVQDATPDYHKLYWRQEAFTNEQATLSGGWTFWIEGTTPYNMR